MGLLSTGPEANGFVQGVGIFNTSYSLSSDAISSLKKTVRSIGSWILTLRHW